MSIYCRFKKRKIRGFAEEKVGRVLKSTFSAGKEMKNVIHIIVLSSCVCSSAFALSPADCKTKIDDARTALLIFLNGERGSAIQTQVRVTAENVSVCLNDLHVDFSKRSQLNEVRDVWEKFKRTREQELVPLIESGKLPAGRTLATGVQKERLDRINTLLREIEGSDF